MLFSPIFILQPSYFFCQFLPEFLAPVSKKSPQAPTLLASRYLPYQALYQLKTRDCQILKGSTPFRGWLGHLPVRFISHLAPIRQLRCPPRFIHNSICIRDLHVLLCCPGKFIETSLLETSDLEELSY